MRYFILNLLAHLLVMIILMIITVVFYERNRKRKTKHGFMFFAPVLFAVITIVYAVMLPAPRLLDVKNVASGKYSSESGIVESIGWFKNTVTIDGVTYCINPRAPMPAIGERVKIKHTSYSRFIMEMEADTTSYEDRI